MSSGTSINFWIPSIEGNKKQRFVVERLIGENGNVIERGFCSGGHAFGSVRNIEILIVKNPLEMPKDWNPREDELENGLYKTLKPEKNLKRRAFGGKGIVL